MNSEAEMRAVILHAAEKLDAVKNRTIRCRADHKYDVTEPVTWMLPNDVSMAMSYAEGILRLLASYLKVDPADRATATPEPGWTGQQPNGDHPAPPQPPAASDVAERFGISERRVAQILEAAGT